MGKGLHQDVIDRAAVRPDDVAVVDQGRQLTYAQLDRQADLAAAELRELGVGPRTYLASAAADGDASTGPGYAAENLASAADELLADRFDSATVSCGMDSVTGAMRRFGVDHLDLLKIDVERYELDVLLGIDEQTWAAINRVVVEVDDRVGELEQVLRVLRDAGMRCEARQAADYRGTSLSMVHAMR